MSALHMETLTAIFDHATAVPEPPLMPVLHMEALDQAYCTQACGFEAFSTVWDGHGSSGQRYLTR